MTTIAQRIKNETADIYEAHATARACVYLVNYDEDLNEDLTTYIFNDNSKLFIQNNTIEVE